ncbi:Oxoglutarate and iron-dependent oxygenase degradation C-term-domain-containing protein [Dimargaris cristalligena]|uniref:Oxoglutarate and iron-dependent oxygenase degradation C-term-domain-containing protein n=1 Tax=Dimargaris cristalligena TaxID=215637 RepID=A0A4P9ZJT8_9FUNG|nr:Oxoglutarate and iron-dependent oxygenase degradation C-term-domain-containing protein [Dimargaris cristalligena]|eukprot:RKP33497.1 Oxoglutarate and iron-dependent oxygenase degradation C-term-domain-containing protein [Dimargaris cristalligena]
MAEPAAKRPRSAPTTTKAAPAVTNRPPPATSNGSGSSDAATPVPADAQFQRAFRSTQPIQTQVTNPAALAQGQTECVAAQIPAGPFSVAVLASVFPDALLRQVRKELDSLPFQHKSNDLYEFYQSPDIATSAAQFRLPGLTQLKDIIYSPAFVQGMESLAGIRLNPNTVDLSAHKYPPGGYLLCHDDDIRQDKEGRRIAFIIYLVKETWSATADGGTLDLFDKDATDQPTDRVLSIAPKWNTFAFFEVGQTSYHQVAEVLGSDDRVSISGWLHGPLPVPVNPAQAWALVPRPLLPAPTLPLDAFITGEYLRTPSIANINQVFVDQSSIELQNFFLPSVFDQVQRALAPVNSKTTGPWSHSAQTGPANAMHYRRHTLRESETADPAILEQLHRLLTSPAFGEYLTRLTNLDDLVEASHEWRSFGPGDYTLLNDQCLEPEGLDVAARNGSKAPRESDNRWDERWQGGMHYVADKETLLTLWPKPNTLSIVFRDSGTLRFVKYVNHLAKMSRTEFSATYFEKS